MDMSETFRGAVQLCLPRARIVADHFHVIQHVGKAVNKVVSRTAKSEPGKKALEGHRHLFLRSQEDLSVEEEQTRASLALAFPELARAWKRKRRLAFLVCDRLGCYGCQRFGRLDRQRQRRRPSRTAQSLVGLSHLASGNPGFL